MGLRLWLLSWSLVVLAGVLHSVLDIESPPRVNYDSEVYFSHEHLRAPSTKEEVIETVKMAIMSGRRLRPLGSGHSWSPVAQSDDLYVSLHRYSGLVELDRQKKRVTVRGGTTLHELNAILEEHGLAMTNLPSVSAQTVAGAISTGTHGTGIEQGSLSTFVTKLEVVSGKGVVVLTADETPNLFKAAQVSLGLLGVITEVTFQCEAAFNLEQTLLLSSLDDCLDNMTAHVHSAQHVKMWIEFYSEQCVVYQVNRSKEAPRDQPNFTIFSIRTLIFEAILWVLSWLPSWTPSVMRTLFVYGDVFRAHNYVDNSAKVFNIPHYFPIHNEAEIAVAVDDCPAAIRELMRVVEELMIPANYVTEVRFVQQDNIWLSPEYGQDTCRITQTIYNPSDATRQLFFKESFRALRRFSPRVHWGKTFELQPDQVKEMYPHLEDFKRIRKQLDPENTFLNGLLERTFGF